MNDTEKQNAPEQSVPEQEKAAAQRLKRLKGKAEISRYAHSKEMHGVRQRRRGLQIFNAGLSLILALGIIFMRNNVFPDWMVWLMVAIAMVPPLTLFVQNIGGIYSWDAREKAHESAVRTWGKWIRKCDDAEADLADLSGSAAQEEVSKMQNDYVECMEETPLIPTNKFLKYKREFKQYKEDSKKIDEEFSRKPPTQE